MPTCIVVSPSLTFGSWAWFEDILLKSPKNISWTVIAYGQPPEVIQPNIRFISLPAFDYVKVGRIMSKTSLMWLNLLYLLPIAIICWYLCLRKRNTIDIVIGNGIAATILLTPCSWIGKTKIWLAYHSFISHLGPFAKKLIRLGLLACNGAIANSTSSKEDLTNVINDHSIFTIEHWANDIYFTGDIIPKVQPRIPLNILYVGRTDNEKFGQCRRVCNQLCHQGIIKLVVVGSKPPDSIIDHDGIDYLGYIRSKETLLSYYQWADLTWAPADIDYISRPGIEALASGCPLIISDIPAVTGKSDGSLRISTSIIPTFAGWVVNADDDTAAIALLERLSEQTEPLADPQKCRAYARMYHSTDNIDKLIDILFTSS